MKSVKMKKGFSLLAALCIMLLASCGASFNTIGIKMGNIINGSELTSQGNTDFYIEEDGIYKDGKKILDGDYSNINAVGEKIYFYDNAERKVCKSNSEGFKVERIGEIYTDKFVAHKDNIIASILVGSGSDDLEAPSNYNIVKMKVTDRKLTSQTPKVIVEGGKLVGSEGDRVFFIKEDEKKGYVLSSVFLDGEEESEIAAIDKDARVIVSNEKIYVLGTNDDEYSLYTMNIDGSDKDVKFEVGKNPDGTNAFNISGDDIYFETYKDEAGTITNNILKYNIEKEESEDLIIRDKRMDFKISVGAKDVYIKEKAHDDLDSVAKWMKLEDFLSEDKEK